MMPTAGAAWLTVPQAETGSGSGSALPRSHSSSKLETKGGQMSRRNKSTPELHKQDGDTAGFLLAKVARLDKALESLPQADLKSLQVSAHKRARKVLRNLSYPSLPSASRGRSEADETMFNMLARAQNPAVAPTRKIPPLAEALASGLESTAVRDFALQARQALSEDLCSAALDRARASLDWVDSQGLMEAVDLQASSANGFTQGSSTRYANGDESPLDLRGEGPILGHGKGTSSTKRWPSMQDFDEFYYIPGDQLPPPKQEEPRRPYDPLPPARPTISGLEASVCCGSSSYLLPALLSSSQLLQQSPRISQPVALKKPQNIFEATGAYRQACDSFGVRPIAPPPVFADTVEISDGFVDGTKQCYAIAEGVKACAPRQAKLVEAAFDSSRLQSLTLSGSPLSYVTCMALCASLRTNKSSSFVELVLAECGLGDDLDEDPDLLPRRAAAMYAKSHSELFKHDEELPPALGLVRIDTRKSSSEAAPAEEQEQKAKESEEAEEAGDGAELEADMEMDEDVISWRATPVALPLFAQLARPHPSVRLLDLSRSILSAAAVSYLSRGLRTMAVEVLKLDNCALDDDAMIEFATQGLAENRHLQELSLRCNSLSGKPGPAAALFDAVGRHPRLAHVDVAENLFPKDKECVEELCAALRWSMSLVAVHLLGCLPGAEKDNLAISAGCRKWMAENDKSHGDSAVQPTEPDEGDGYKELVLCRALHVEGLQYWRAVSPEAPVSTLPVQAARGAPEPALESWMPACCWICTKCTAVDYTWTVPDKGDGDETGAIDAKLFVRPSFADFARVELKRLRIAGARRAQFGARMLVPRGTHFHIFEAQVGSKHTLHCAATERKVEIGDSQLSANQNETLDKIRRQYRYSGALNLLPEQSSERFQIPEELRGLTPEKAEPDDWAVEPTRQQFWLECCKVDMQHIHLQDLCHKDEEGDVKAALRELYSHYYECYAMFAGRSQWPLIRQVDVYTVFEEANLLEREQIGPPLPPPSGVTKVSVQASELSGASSESMAFPQLKVLDVQSMIIQTIANRQEGGSVERVLDKKEKSLKRAAEVAQRTRESAPLTRPQFIEVLLRAAICLKANSREPSIAVAFRRFANDVISSRIMQPPVAPFPRGLTMRVGFVSDVFLARRKTLREAWERFGSSEVAFQRLAQLLKLCDRSFTAKHVASFYALVRRPQPELNPVSAAQNMSSAGTGAGGGLRYSEFCEAVARLSFVWSPASSSGNTFGGRDQAPREWPLQPQVGQPVQEKAFAARLDSFTIKLAERMRPSVMGP